MRRVNDPVPEKALEKHGRTATYSRPTRCTRVFLLRQLIRLERLVRVGVQCWRDAGGLRPSSDLQSHPSIAIAPGLYGIFYETPLCRATAEGRFGGAH